MPKAGAEQETIYEGIPASPGIAIAPVHVVARGFSAPEVYEIPESEVGREQERFRQALDALEHVMREGNADALESLIDKASATRAHWRMGAAPKK